MKGERSRRGAAPEEEAVGAVEGPQQAQDKGQALRVPDGAVESIELTGGGSRIGE